MEVYKKKPETLGESGLNFFKTYFKTQKSKLYSNLKIKNKPYCPLVLSLSLTEVTSVSKFKFNLLFLFGNGFSVKFEMV